MRSHFVTIRDEGRDLCHGVSGEEMRGAAREAREQVMKERWEEEEGCVYVNTSCKLT